MIELRDVTKSFKGRPALHSLSLSVERGEVFGLLGHNGAGKSTALGILLGQVYPDGGEAWINGVSVQRDRGRALRRVGAIFETPGFYDYLSGWRNLEIFSRYTAPVSKSEIEEAVEIVGLSERIHDPVRVYSHGMRQRLALGQALLPAPELVLLDEPTEGLDPEGIHEIRTLIQRLTRERGLTVLLSSHLLSEVEQLCTRVTILNQGRKIFDGRWGELASEQKRVRLEVDDWDRALTVLEGCAVAAERGVVMMQPGADVPDLVERLVHKGLRVHAVEPVRRGLEEIYLELVQPLSPRSQSLEAGRLAANESERR